MFSRWPILRLAELPGVDVRIFTYLRIVKHPSEKICKKAAKAAANGWDRL